MRTDYPYVQTIPTRWMDNDVYGHVNNVTYYSYFDTVINTWLINEGGLDIHTGAQIGLCAESHCKPACASKNSAAPASVTPSAFSSNTAPNP